MSRNDAVERLNRKARSCDAPVAERAGDASSPEPPRKPNGMAGFSRDEGVAAARGGDCIVPVERHHGIQTSSGLTGFTPLDRTLAGKKLFTGGKRVAVGRISV
ncbi:MAG: hypothetical protein ABSE90_02160 [Verrucomicrobiota bacterium]